MAFWRSVALGPKIGNYSQTKTRSATNLESVIELREIPCFNAPDKDVILAVFLSQGSQPAARIPPVVRRSFPGGTHYIFQKLRKLFVFTELLTQRNVVI